MRKKLMEKWMGKAILTAVFIGAGTQPQLFSAAFEWTREAMFSWTVHVVFSHLLNL